MALPKIGRDVTLKSYLDKTVGEHNGHGYDDWMAERHRQVALNKRVNKSELARFMGIERIETITNWIAVEEKVQG